VDALALVSGSERKEEELPARRDFRDLLNDDDTTGRVRRVSRARSRFRSRTLVAYLLAEARERLQDDPEESLGWAEVATTITQLDTHMPDCLVLAIAYAGNAKRAAGDLVGAEEGLSRSRRLLSGLAVSPWLEAEVLSLEGSLRKDQRKLRLAERLLERSRLLFGGHRAMAGRVTLVLASVHRLGANYPRAVRGITEALELLGTDEPRVTFWALHNLATYLCEAGRAPVAKALYDLLGPQYWRFPDRHPKIRGQWLRGMIARELGEPERGEADFRAVIGAFADEGSYFLAALAALDLAEMLVAGGRDNEVCEIAAALPPIFRRQGVLREARAAAALFYQAAERRRVTHRLIAQLRTFFELAQVDRSVRLRRIVTDQDAGD
jgi:hypothetical protein